MQMTGPHEGHTQDQITNHVEWGSSGVGLLGEALMWCPVSTPGFADRRLSVGAGNTVNLDLTGYRVMPVEWHPSIAFPVMAGILEEDVPARAVATFPTQTISPIQIVSYGKVYALVNFPGNRETGTPVIPDETTTGKLRTLDAGNNVLNEPSFATTTKWTTTADWGFAGQAAVFTQATGAGTLNQSAANRPQNTYDNTWYRFSYTSTPGGGFDSGGAAATITTGFASAAITLPKTAGTHTVTFLSSATTGDSGNFTINVAGAGAGETWTIDNVRLSQVGTSGADESFQHLVCGHLLEDWVGGAAQGLVRIMARCI